MAKTPSKPSMGNPKMSKSNVKTMVKNMKKGKC